MGQGRIGQANGGCGFCLRFLSPPTLVLGLGEDKMCQMSTVLSSRGMSEMNDTSLVLFLSILSSLFCLNSVLCIAKYVEVCCN